MDKSSKSKSSLSVQTIVLAEIAWAVAALLFFLLFSVTAPGEKRPFWYSAGTSFFEAIAFLVAAFLCYRNWRSPQIVSGRNVWLFIGLGMFCYFIGNLLFSYWELNLGIEPDVSPGDFFFVLTYIFLIVGMVLAVASRRLNLEIWQWGIVAVIGVLGIILAGAVSLPVGAPVQSVLMQPVAAQTVPAKPSPKAPSGKANSKAATPEKSKPTPAATKSAPATTAKPSPASSGQPIPAIATEERANTPEWAKSLEELLSPLKPILDWFYVITDILLLIIATTLLLAFWGGRFAQSWRMIAAAAFSLYIADIWFKYATNRLEGYQSGGLLEVFWVFSGVLFGMGAALEYDLSSRSRSRSGRRRAS
ncbi:hypothetical protein K9N68_04935 [Kovacikia minuta CCNUW1]|uniref:hypothetical protein n=1 Tax=Kovacikia minuta TaxID=2931930 RepID=UPI001CCD4F95|nr:hypothetical protein [Kovacikia minuta]UBF27306.1 hypothetical protein K9N68_04935 [Kovacikia minuta CCNUW1]